MNNKYNYIIITMTGDFYDCVYGEEVKRLNYAYYDSCFPKNKFLKFLKRIHFSSKVNSFIKLPYKEIWIDLMLKIYKRKTKLMKDNQKPVCFILFADCLPLENNFFSKKIKYYFPTSKIVYFFQDIISLDINKKNFIKNKSKYVDAIYSFDLMDAKKYNIFFHNLPYSFPILLNKEHYDLKYDVFFCGAAKNRLDDIINAYISLKLQGLKCLFIITRVNKSEQKYAGEIKYCNFINYNQYLRYLQESKCVLEIIQKNSSGNTLRTNEAIAYNKLLLSNNQELMQNNLFDDNNMKVFSDLSVLDVKTFLTQYPVQYKKQEKISVSQFFLDIEHDLEYLDKKLYYE